MWDRVGKNVTSQRRSPGIDERRGARRHQVNRDGGTTRGRRANLARGDLEDPSRVLLHSTWPLERPSPAQRLEADPCGHHFLGAGERGVRLLALLRRQERLVEGLEVGPARSMMAHRGGVYPAPAPPPVRPTA